MRKSRIGIMVVLCIVAIVGVAAIITPAAQARFICECANLDAPVKCKGGKIYPNPCVAHCFGATNCVPYGG